MANTKEEDTTPVHRSRQAQQDHVSDKEQGNRQKAAVEAHEARVADIQARNIALSTPIKLSVKEFVGKVVSEPDKDPMEEARKQGTVGSGPGVMDETEFETIEQKAHGKVVDRIVITDAIRESGVPGATPLTEPQKTQAVIDEEVGKKGEKDPSDKAQQKTLEEAQETVAGIQH